MKNNLKILSLAISLILILSIAGCTNDKSSPSKKASESTSQDTVTSDKNITMKDASNYTWKKDTDKIIITNIQVKDNNISFELKNATSNNTLLSAKFEYLRTDSTNSAAPMSLDFDGPPLDFEKSTVLTYNPLKPLGNSGEIIVKELIFKNEQDNYNANK